MAAEILTETNIGDITAVASLANTDELVAIMALKKNDFDVGNAVMVRLDRLCLSPIIVNWLCLPSICPGVARTKEWRCRRKTWRCEEFSRSLGQRHPSSM